MKEQTQIHFTYEEVKDALISRFGLKLDGVKASPLSGYIVASCDATEQPYSSIKFTPSEERKAKEATS